MYNDFWMADQGFGVGPVHGDLRDLISRPFSRRAPSSVLRRMIRLRLPTPDRLYTFRNWR